MCKWFYFTSSTTMNWTNKGANSPSTCPDAFEIPKTIPANLGDKSIIFVALPHTKDAWDTLIITIKKMAMAFWDSSKYDRPIRLPAIPEQPKIIIFLINFYLSYLHFKFLLVTFPLLSKCSKIGRKNWWRRKSLTHINQPIANK